MKETTNHLFMIEITSLSAAETMSPLTSHFP